MPKHFLEHYEVHKKPEAKAAAKKKGLREERTDIASDRFETIQAYIERLRDFFLHPNPDRRKRNIERAKPSLYTKTVIRKEDFPESHFSYNQRLAKERGLGDVTFSATERSQEIARVIEGQKKSLDAWIEYLTSDDCVYPADVKYFAIQGILKLGTFDTERYLFTKREPSTTAPFAEIDREALSKVLGALDAKHAGKKTDSYSPALLATIEHGKSFGDMYALTMRELDQALNKEELLPITQGEWRRFAKGSDPQELVKALEGKRSNLCIADIGSATSYLNQGSVDIYFSNNQAGRPMMPRVAIASAEDKGGVYEVRGTFNKNEDVDPYLEETDILTTRLTDLPNGEVFAKKDVAMKKLTAIYYKSFREDRKTKERTYLNPELTKDELRFLYGADGPIIGFGYGDEDPRVGELLSQRNKRADLCTIFNCTEEELERKEHVLLRDIPAFSKIPSENDIKKDFKFDSIWSAEYRKDRLLTDFALTEKDFKNIGLEKPIQDSILEAIKAASEDDEAGTNLDKIGFTKKELARARTALMETKEALPEAKVFDIGDAIRKKKQADPSHPNYLSTKEVLEAIDEAGYRPATLKELLAYGRDHWKPDADPKTLTDEEKLLQRASAPYIYALGSPFSSADAYRMAPALGWGGDERYLLAFDLVLVWHSGYRFLVLRK